MDKIKTYLKILLLNSEQQDFRILISILLRYCAFVVCIPRSIYLLLKNVQLQKKIIIQYIPYAGHSSELTNGIVDSENIVVLVDNNAKKLNFTHSAIYFPGDFFWVRWIIKYSVVKFFDFDIVMQSNSSAVPIFYNFFRYFDKDYFSQTTVDSTIDREIFYKISKYAKTFQTPNITKSEAIKILKNNEYIILKAIDTQGSRGVYKINNIKDFNTILENSAKKVFIYERNIIGKQYHFNALVCNGKADVYEVTREYPNVPVLGKEIIPYLTIYNHNYLDTHLNYLDEIHSEIAEITEMNYGVIDLEIIINNGIFYVIDFAARVGADWPFVQDMASNENFSDHYVSSLKNKKYKRNINSNNKSIFRMHPKFKSNLFYIDMVNELEFCMNKYGYDYYYVDYDKANYWIDKIDNYVCLHNV